MFAASILTELRTNNKK